MLLKEEFYNLIVLADHAGDANHNLIVGKTQNSLVGTGRIENSNRASRGVSPNRIAGNKCPSGNGKGCTAGIAF
jgi:hypothetical protein